eukprot:TRINITY_DN6724_c0_g1_i1.p1 TRINITY_DN6724_c0_g1~~TRINITY_DN6724_c0_g1_i1.p1  ORF type:complete len:569 (-),score=65.58 TRINITY_DN6724_c0_g1_i1:994-2700(-)
MKKPTRWEFMRTGLIVLICVTLIGVLYHINLEGEDEEQKDLVAESTPHEATWTGTIGGGGEEGGDDWGLPNFTRQRHERVKKLRAAQKRRQAASAKLAFVGRLLGNLRVVRASLSRALGLASNAGPEWPTSGTNASSSSLEEAELQPIANGVAQMTSPQKLQASTEGPQREQQQRQEAGKLSASVDPQLHSVQSKKKQKSSKQSEPLQKYEQEPDVEPNLQKQVLDEAAIAQSQSKGEQGNTITGDSADYDDVDRGFFSQARKVEAGKRQEGAESPAKGGKVAFLFLAKGPMPFDELWEKFFEGRPRALYSIYISSPPGFEYNSHTTNATVFYGRNVRPALAGPEGAPGFALRAERRLLAMALTDKANEVFVLLSDSCIPLWNFDYVYEYLISANHSFIASVGTDLRWTSAFEPEIPLEKWRKGSQWFALLRDHALLVINDSVLFPAFLRGGSFEFMEEHYVQTLISLRDPSRVERRPVTYVEWRADDSFQPHAFKSSEVNETLINGIRSLTRTEPVRFPLLPGWKNSADCRLSGKPSHCFLFARPFDADTAKILQNMSQLFKNRLLG